MACLSWSHCPFCGQGAMVECGAQISCLHSIPALKILGCTVYYTSWIEINTPFRNCFKNCVAKYFCSVTLME